MKFQIKKDEKSKDTKNQLRFKKAIRKMLMQRKENKIASDTIDEMLSARKKDRRTFRNDPVEMTEKYLAVIDSVEEKIEKTRETYGHGSCHETWILKQEYLAEYGIRWTSPVHLNPGFHFD